MSRSPLSPNQSEFWHAFERAHEVVSSLIETELEERAELSSPELEVLSRLTDLGEGKLRQHRLADSLHWEKSRLSHQLSRMEAKTLVERKRDSAKSVTVQITRRGRAVLVRAREVHAEAVRQHLLERVSARDRAVLERIYTQLLRNPC